MADNGFDTDSEDEMPSGWEERSTLDGRVYFVNHETKSTQWTHPITGKQKRVVGELPYGWERQYTEDGIIIYVDHVNEKTTYTDPRLAFSVEDTGKPNKIRQKYDGSSTALQVLHGRDLNGKVVLITGANTGIGYETAKSLAIHGAHVILACRSLARANEAIQRMKLVKEKISVEAVHLDLSSLKQVKEFATDFKLKHDHVDIVILNAGVMGQAYTQTEDGYELTFQVNHLAHFYLMKLLEPTLIQSAPCRVIIVSSESHRSSNITAESISCEKLSPICASQYSALMAYNNSKFCNVVFARTLDSRLRDRGVRCNSLHPGNLVSTDLSRSWWLFRLIFAVVRPFTKSLQQGASTSVFCAIDPELENVGGLYFNNCCVCPPTDVSNDPFIADELWRLSEQMIDTALSK